MNSTIVLLTVAGLESTMWGRRIVAAAKRGDWNDYDLSMAGRWTSCACGQMDPWIEIANGCPADSELWMLGCKFGKLRTTEQGDMFERAACLLIAIHTRSMELYDEAVELGLDWTKLERNA
tara:strand:+ start:1580 stop:1942 length:363 start_codon:yes stop_codon:yes gene_type:complete